MLEKIEDSPLKVDGLSKVFRVPQKDPGLKGAIRSVFARKWRDKIAVDRISFSARRGEIVGIVGANGAGKTTLIKMLSGIIHPSSGAAQVLGHVPWERQINFRRQIALVMGQKAQLWWDLPATDCFELLREIYRIPLEQYRKNLDYLVQTLGVGTLLSTPVRRLSLGERMKMELIAALLHNPGVVYLDEPTIGLDLNAQKALRQFLLDYRKAHAPVMLLTSHYMEDIEKLCERILIIRQGQLVYDGSLEKIVRTYATSKIISARRVASDLPSTLHIPSDLGQVLEQSNERVRVRCPRGRVNDAATLILREFGADDLAIEEEDIGTIIGSLLQETPGSPGGLLQDRNTT